ncbi:MAG TPA: hypothetical protein VK616_10800 [Flavitalea sp.]|nr:hypothetical protein [Flavitalea sp.]
MHRELLNQAVGIFNSSEKWNAFVELANQKENIKWYYFQKLKQPLLNYFNANPVHGWVCEPWGNQLYDIRWYLKDFGKDSLALAIGWTFEFHLHLQDTMAFDTDKINELLKTDHSILLSAFGRVDRQFEENTKAMESRNYEFGTPYDFNFDNSQIDKLSWFAGNETEKFVQQIIKKVECFRKDENLTKLLYDLNAQTNLRIK